MQPIGKLLSPLSAGLYPAQMRLCESYARRQYPAAELSLRRLNARQNIPHELCGTLTKPLPIDGQLIPTGSSYTGKDSRHSPRHSRVKAIIRKGLNQTGASNEAPVWFNLVCSSK
jgi:hypothetical protein